MQELATTLHRHVIASFRRLDKPVIAAVNVIFAGAGFSPTLYIARLLHRHAMETTVRLSEGPTLAYASTEQLLDQSWGTELERQLASEAATFASIGLTHDFQEGIRAFTQKRRAVFQGN